MVDSLKLIKRIKYSEDGNDFIDYLKTLSQDNYEAFKNSPPSASEMHKGYGLAIDSLIKVFETCDDRLAKFDDSPIGQEWL